MILSTMSNFEDIPKYKYGHVVKRNCAKASPFVGEKLVTNFCRQICTRVSVSCRKELDPLFDTDEHSFCTRFLFILRHVRTRFTHRT